MTFEVLQSILDYFGVFRVVVTTKSICASEFELKTYPINWLVGISPNSSSIHCGFTNSDINDSSLIALSPCWPLLEWVETQSNLSRMNESFRAISIRVRSLPFFIYLWPLKHLGLSTGFKWIWTCSDLFELNSFMNSIAVTNKSEGSFEVQTYFSCCRLHQNTGICLTVRKLFWLHLNGLNYLELLVRLITDLLDPCQYGMMMKLLLPLTAMLSEVNRMTYPSVLAVSSHSNCF